MNDEKEPTWLEIFEEKPLLFIFLWLAMIGVPVFLILEILRLI